MLRVDETQDTFGIAAHQEETGLLTRSVPEHSIRLPIDSSAASNRRSSTAAANRRHSACSSACWRSSSSARSKALGEAQAVQAASRVSAQRAHGLRSLLIGLPANGRTEIRQAVGEVPGRYGEPSGRLVRTP